MSNFRHEIYRQKAWDDEGDCDPPVGLGWEPFSVTSPDLNDVIWWRRRIDVRTEDSCESELNAV